MTQQLVINKHVQKSTQSNPVFCAGSRVKNSLQNDATKIGAMDLMGLSWIFADEEVGISDDVQL